MLLVTSEHIEGAQRRLGFMTADFNLCVASCLPNPRREGHTPDNPTGHGRLREAIPAPRRRQR